MRVHSKLQIQWVIPVDVCHGVTTKSPAMSLHRALPPNMTMTITCRFFCLPLMLTIAGLALLETMLLWGYRMPSTALI